MYNLVAGANRLLFKPYDQALGALPDLTRHRIFYAATKDAASAANSATLRVRVDYSDPHTSDLLTIDFVPGYDHLGLRLIKPVGETRFNALEPSAPIDKVRAIVARRLDWMDRIILPIDGDRRAEMDLDVSLTLDPIFQRLRLDGFDHPVAEAGTYEPTFGRPFNLPNVSWTESTGPMNGWPRRCFTDEGRAMLTEVMPTILSFSHRRYNDGVEMETFGHIIESLDLDGAKRTVDLTKSFRRWPEEVDQTLVVPFQSER